MRAGSGLLRAIAGPMLSALFATGCGGPGGESPHKVFVMLEAPIGC